MASSQLFFPYFNMILLIVFCNLCGGHFAPSATATESKHAISTHGNKLSYGSCSRRDISISQNKISRSGIPEYEVQIANMCTSEGGSCGAIDIHLHCGWFASARVVKPNIFKRVSEDDCLVNGGRPLKPNQIISFTYSNTFMYPLAFKSANFLC